MRADNCSSHRGKRAFPILCVALLPWLTAFLLLSTTHPLSALSSSDFQPLLFTNAPQQILPARLWIPRNASTNVAYPLVVFLHGAGERGTDNRAQVDGTQSALRFALPENQSQWPCFILAPQCPAGLTWAGLNAGDNWSDTDGTGDFTAQPTWPLLAFMKLLQQLTNAAPAGLRIDPAQIHITGLSMGGFGTWESISRWPGVFRSAVPICGGGDPLKAPVIGDTRVWAIHAEDDSTVPVDRSRQMILALRRLGISPRFTEYPASLGIGHGAWVPGYADPGLLPWIFSTPEPAAAADQASAPGFSLASGTSIGNTWVSLSSQTEGSILRYTLNGTVPDASSPLYAGPIPIYGPTFLRAIALKAGLRTSPASSADYNASPSLLVRPQSQSVLVGRSVSFQVTAVGKGPLRYQWSRDGVPITDATNSVLALGAVTLSHNGVYRVEVSDDVATTTPPPAVLIVSIRPALTLSPVSLNVVEGDSAQFEAAATGTLPLTFRWRRNGAILTNIILNSTQCVLTLPVASSALGGNYTVAVTNFGGSSATSSNAVLTVLRDYDHDGLPDVWEDRFQLNTNSLNEASSDLDGDGMTTRQEWLSGTDPTQKGSVFVIQESSMTPAGFRIRFSSVLGKLYGLERAESVVLPQPWLPVTGAGRLWGTGAPMEFVDREFMSHSPAYYRVRVKN